MNALIQQAAHAVDQAELYWNQKHEIKVNYEDCRLQTITENEVSSVALRIIHQGKFGSSYGIRPDQPDLLDGAMTAAAYGDPATFSFASAADYPEVETCDPRTAKLSSADLAGICESIKTRIERERSDLSLRLQALMRASTLTIETTGGVRASGEATALEVGFGAPIKGAGLDVAKHFASVSPERVDDELIGEFLEWYEWTETTSTPSTGRLPAILAPEASFLFLVPLMAGLSGDAVEKRTSPLRDKLGEKILSEKLTVLDNPLLDRHVQSRAFDDEGVPCQSRPVVEEGILKDYLLDLRTAAALGRSSTGNGCKRALFGKGAEFMPSPWAINLTIEEGAIPYRRMIADLDEGILLTSGMGFHSGNYPQGHFAVQAVGYHIRSGKVVGRLDKTMVSGNIYEDFINIRDISSDSAIGETGLFSFGSPNPYILVDGLQVAGK